MDDQIGSDRDVRGVGLAVGFFIGVGVSVYTGIHLALVGGLILGVLLDDWLSL